MTAETLDFTLRAEHTFPPPNLVSADRQHTPWWLHLRLWGLDAPLAALAWALVYARQLSILDTPSEPIFLLCVSVWAFNLLDRLLALIVYRENPLYCWKPAFYRAHLVPMSLLLFSALLSALWLALFQVGVYYLSFAFFPAVCWLLAAALPGMWREPTVRRLLRAWAFAMACSAPAWFYSIAATPWDILFYGPTLAFTVLVFLFLLGRDFAQNENRAILAERRGMHILLPAGLFLLLIYCIAAAAFRSSGESTFYYATAIGAALLQVAERFRPYLSRDGIAALGWLLVALPGFFAYFLL